MGENKKTAKSVINQLAKYADSDKAKTLSRFFKTSKGQYGEGDKFLGITVPKQRIVAKNNITINLSELLPLLKSPFHEHRLTALLILTYKYPKSSLKERQDIIDLYLKNTKYVNNWNLVDLSAPKLLGQYLTDNPSKKPILNRLASSKNLWDNRIAILSTFTFIRNNEFKPTINLSEKLLNHPHDLMHKAIGWMLREVGKKDQKKLLSFLDKHYQKMPRTMLRYAIERLDDKTRAYYMQK